MSKLQLEKAGDLNAREILRSLYTGISIFYTFEKENLTFPKAKLTRGLASTTGLAENIAILCTGSGFRVCIIPELAISSNLRYYFRDLLLNIGRLYDED